MPLLGMKQRTRKQGETIPIKDALQLEEYEQTQIKNSRTRRAIHDTYGEKQPTKARRKLPGKRKWKNKTEQYKVLEGRMTAKEFNLKQRASKIITRLFQESQAEQEKKDRHLLHGDE
jgi:hypothetical protein